MSWSSRYDWKFVARASVVIGLVFAALVSSWVGIGAERRAKQEGRDRTDAFALAKAAA